MCEDTSKTCTVKLDKDQNEIDAALNALLVDSVLLCHFHFSNISEKVSKLLLPVDEKNELFAQCKALGPHTQNKYSNDYFHQLLKIVKS